MSKMQGAHEVNLTNRQRVSIVQLPPKPQLQTYGRIPGVREEVRMVAWRERVGDIDTNRGR